MISEKTKVSTGQNFLTIGEPLCYSFGALGRHAELENQSIYHGLIRENGYEMTRKNGTKASNFFHTSYPELIQAHSSGKRSDVDKLCRKLQTDLRPYAATLANNFHFTTIDLNDFIQEGLISLVKYLPKYRYICSHCGARFSRVGEYNDHCRSEYGRLTKPVQSIRSFLSGIIRGSMLNFLRAQLRLKRSPIIFVSMADSLERSKREYFENEKMNPETLLASKEAIKGIRDCLDRERNKKIKEFVGLILEGATAPEAHLGISQQGLAASSQSARITIYRLKQQTQSFQKYRVVLAG